MKLLIALIVAAVLAVAPVSAEAPDLTDVQKLTVLNAARQVQIARMGVVIAEQQYALVTMSLERPGFAIEVDINNNNVTLRPIATGADASGPPKEKKQ